MTTLSTAQVVKQFMDRIGAGDIDGAIAMHTDDIVLDFQVPPTSCRGRAAGRGRRRAIGTAR